METVQEQRKTIKIGLRGKLKINNLSDIVEGNILDISGPFPRKELIIEHDNKVFTLRRSSPEKINLVEYWVSYTSGKYCLNEQIKPEKHVMGVSGLYEKYNLLLEEAKL